MFIGVLAYSVIFGLMSVLLHDIYASQSALGKEITLIKKLGKQLKLTNETKKKVVTWTENEWESQISGGVYLLNKPTLPSSLRHEIIESCFLKKLCSQTVFANAPKTLVLYLAEVMKIATSIPNEAILQEFDINANVFIVIRGKIKICREATGYSNVYFYALKYILHANQLPKKRKQYIKKI